jgi:F-type H+-transporting ATPase subunit c
MNLFHIGLGYLGAGWGAGLIMLAAAGGIAKLSAAALEGTARQPEAAGNLRTSMLIPAALIEGLGFFALVICLLMALALNGVIAKGG